MKILLLPLSRSLTKLLVLTMMMVLCVKVLYKDRADGDAVTTQVLGLEYVKTVEDWPHGIKFARWDTDTDVDWNWLGILDKLLVPGEII